MRTAEWIQIIFASLFAGAALVSPLSWRRRVRVTLLAFFVIVAIVVVWHLTRLLTPLSSTVLRDWLPAALFLLPYWQTGQFFVAPNRNMQEKLAAFDRKVLHILRWQSPKALGKRVASFLEIAYLTVYPLVPVGLAVLYIAEMRRYADHYWTVVLLATYICYAITPFVQALPPRLLPSAEGMSPIPYTRARALNGWIVRNASIRVITFPSAHVASAVAASLVLLQLVPSAGMPFACLTIAIAIACVLGGYHYAADVLAGILVALVVFVSTGA